MAFTELGKAVRFLRHRLGQGAGRPEKPGVECGHNWYDNLYKNSESYQLPYPQSHYYFLWTVIVDRIRRAKIRRVLEIGCGPGQLASFLIEQGIEEYHGLDFSPTAIDMARGNAPTGHFEVGDAVHSDIYTRVEHEALICTEVLEHINDDLKVVSRFRAGKRCFCSVPNFSDPSHVRHFRDPGEVGDRYARFFDEFEVIALKSPRSMPDQFFLLDGVRNDHCGC